MSRLDFSLVEMSTLRSLRKSQEGQVLIPSRSDQFHQTNPTVRDIKQLWKNSIQTIRDSSDVLRHIIKNVSSRLVGMVRLETLFRALLDAPDRGISLLCYESTDQDRKEHVTVKLGKCKSPTTMVDHVQKHHKEKWSGVHKTGKQQ